MSTKYNVYSKDNVKMKTNSIMHTDNSAECVKVFQQPAEVRGTRFGTYFIATSPSFG